VTGNRIQPAHIDGSETVKWSLKSKIADFFED